MPWHKLRGNLQQDHPLAKYTSWKIGGKAEYFYEPADLEDLKLLLKNWHKRPITVIGAATNVLIRDKGIKGLVIYLRNCLNDLKILDDYTVSVEAGVGLACLLQKCTCFGMSDAAFMAGIPGTVGGALAMNAGANGSCIWNYVAAVKTINYCSGEIKLRDAEEFTASYRKVVGLPAEEWFVAANLFFARDGDAEKIKEKISAYLQKRKMTQPLEYPNCGSVFRNPQDNIAAQLIEASGLKGRQIGDARVSEKHANFIINCGKASAADVEILMQEIIYTVKQKYNISLITEVNILGEK